VPAVTVVDLLTLPRVPRPDAAVARPRPVRSITTAPRGFEGEGFPVRRAFHGVDLADLDPFIHLDQMGEVEYAPGEPKGTPWHPHRGFETVTYMLDGTLRHADTQWMTAGSGLLHIEAPPEEVVMKGGLFHGFQLWVNLPAAKKWSPPRYQDLGAGDVRLLTSHDGGALLRLIAGDLGGQTGPGSTHTPIVLVHATVEPGARVSLPWRRDFNALVYTLAGRGTVGAERRPVEMGQLAVLGAGDTVELAAHESQETRAPKLDVLILGGLPIREPVAWYGPFVMNTRAELQQAFDDFNAGKLGRIPALHQGGNVVPDGA
jgi:redox-sensitive bicupin YhaK (pirin superfamily)